jgi:hypothetical protein
MSDSQQIIGMLGTIITMLSDISKKVDSNHDEGMLENVRAWQENCAREEHEQTEKPKKRRPRKERDPLLPKRGKSAYFLWCENTRKSVRSDMEKEILAECEEGETPRLISAAVVSKRLGEIWKTIGEEEKTRYKDLAKSDMERYYTEKASYEAEHGIVKTKVSKVGISPDTEAHAVFPEGWSSPIDGFLAKHPVDPATGKRIQRSFDTFEEAFAEAERLGKACGGITLSTNAKGTRRLTLREATSVTFNAEWSRYRKEISYLAPH